MKKYMPTLSVIAAGVLWGVISLFIKALSADGLDAMEIGAIRLFVAAPLFALTTAVASPKKLKIDLRDIWMFAGTGMISIVLFNSLYFYTMIHAQASSAVVLLYTSPVFIMLLSAAIFKERITRRKIAALFMTVAGCTLVAGLSGSSGLTALTLITGLSSGLFYGLYTIFGRFALKKYDPATVTVYTFILGMIGYAPIGKPLHIFKTIAARPSLIPICLGIGIICTILPYFLYTWGLAGMGSGKAAILAAVEPLVGSVIGMTFFHESAGAAKLIGIGLIVGSLTLLNVPAKEDRLARQDQ